MTVRSSYGGVFDGTIRWARELLPTAGCLAPFRVETKKAKDMDGDFAGYFGYYEHTDPLKRVISGLIWVKRGLGVAVATEFLLHELAHHMDEVITGPSRVEHRGSWGRYLAFLRKKGW